MTGRISTRAQNEIFVANLKEITREAFDSARKVSLGGKKSEYMRDLGKFTGQALRLRSNILRIESYLENISLVKTRLASTSSVLEKLNTMARRIRNNIMQGLNSDKVATHKLITQSPMDLKEAQKLMNTALNGVFLFGNGFDRAPVDTSSLPTPTNTDPANYTYYMGGTSPLVAMIDDDPDGFSYGVSSHNSAFERMIRSLILISSATVTDKARIEVALTAMNTALTELGNIQAEVGQQQVSIEESEKKYKQLVEQVRETYRGIGTEDFPTIITRNNDIHMQLKAAQYITKKMQENSLIND